MGLQTAQVLQKNGFDVVFTRDNDYFVPLDQRTQYAQHHKGDLFISLHANASSNKNVSGLETFCLQPHLFTDNHKHMHHKEHAVALASRKKLHTTSKKLADLVHTSLLSHARKEHTKLKDRKVKYKTAQVLLGSHIPAILIELGFLSHEQERSFLQNKNYQKRLAYGICDAVKKFIG